MELIKEVVPKISNDYEGIDGIVIVRHGKLVLDEHFNGYNPEKQHKAFSITKSILSSTSFLTGWRYLPSTIDRIVFFRS